MRLKPAPLPALRLRLADGTEHQAHVVHLPEDSVVTLALPSLRDAADSKPGITTLTVSPPLSFTSNELLITVELSDSGKESIWVQVSQQGVDASGNQLCTVEASTVGLLERYCAAVGSRVAIETLRGHRGIQRPEMAALLRHLEAFPTKLPNHPASAANVLLDGPSSPVTGLLHALQTSLSTSPDLFGPHASRVAKDVAKLASEVQAWSALRGPVAPTAGCHLILVHLSDVVRRVSQALRFDSLSALAAKPATQGAQHRLTARIIGERLQAFYRNSRIATSNDAVLGALLEAELLAMLREWVAPLRVTSGTVAGLALEQQVDAIIWDGQVRPAVVSAGDVAVVDPLAVRGVIEVKASTDNLGKLALRMLDLRAQFDALRTEFPRHVPPPAPAAVLWNRHTYDYVRATSMGTATSLFHKSGARLTLNELGVMDLVRFTYRRVLGARHADRI